MSFTYTPGTPVFYVRSLIPDTISPGQFSDEEINGFMQINQMQWQSSMFYSYPAGAINLPQTPSNFLRAAALALNVLAGLAAKQAVSKLLDVQLNGPASAKALGDRAQAYLDMDDNSGAFAIAEQVNTVWALRDRWNAQIQRQAGGATV